MKRMLIAMAMSLPAAAPAFAAVENHPELELGPKAAIVAAPHGSAPFIHPAAPGLQLAARPESPPEHPRSACESDRALCYDAGHIVFRPARRFMPEVSGLKAENISVKRDRIIFRYSF